MKNSVILAGVCAFLCFVSCSKKKEEKEETGKFTVTTAMVIDTSFTKEYVSQIKSVRNIEIRTQEKGFLQTIYVDEGQTVAAGQLLFKIASKLYEADLMKAQAEAKSAEIELNQTATLTDKNVVSKSEKQIAQAKYDMAKAEVTMAKLHLSFTEIRAPFAGTIDRIPKKLGSLIEEGELLTSLSDNSKVFAYYNVSEPEYLEYQTNVKGRANAVVKLLLANGQLLKYNGKVEVIESEFDSETGNVAFRASFTNPDKLLKNGETGKVLMQVPVKNAMIIPQKSTYEIQDKKFVFVVDKNNIVKSREISISGSMPDLYVIKSGLLATDKILLEGVQKAKDDEKIKYDFQKPETVLAHLKYQTN